MQVKTRLLQRDRRGGAARGSPRSWNLSCSKGKPRIEMNRKGDIHLAGDRPKKKGGGGMGGGGQGGRWGA